MTRPRLLLLVSLAPLLAPAPARALVIGGSEYDFHATQGEGVPFYEGFPSRPLVLAPLQSQARGGAGASLSDSVVFENWALPVGAGFGVVPRLEVGLDMDVRLAPWAIQNVLSRIRLYGRWLVLEERFAAELALFVPTAAGATFGLELLTPARFATGDLEVVGQANLGYAGSAFADLVQLGAAATGLYNLPGDFFVAVDLGLHLTVAKAAIEIPGAPESDWVSGAVLPLGLGGGYRLTDDLFIKGSFSLLDLASDEPFAARAVQIVLVQLIDLTLPSAPRRATEAPPPEPSPEPAPAADPEIEPIPKGKS